MIRLLSFVTVLLVPALALGQEPDKQCVEGKPDHCAQPLAEGEPAPYAGMLYTAQLALDHAEKVHSYDDRLQAELDRLTGAHQAAIVREQRMREIDRELYLQKEEVWKRAVDAATPPFYERPAVVIPLTAIVVTAAIVGALAVSAEMGQAWAR